MSRMFAMASFGLAFLGGCNELADQTDKNGTPASAKSGESAAACSDPTAGFSMPARADRCSREKVFAALQAFNTAHKSLPDDFDGMTMSHLKLPSGASPAFYYDIKDNCVREEQSGFSAGITLEKTFVGSDCPVSIREFGTAYKDATVCKEQDYSVDSAELQTKSGFLSSQIKYRSWFGENGGFFTAKAGTFSTVAYGKVHFRDRLEAPNTRDAEGMSRFAVIEVAFDDCSSKLEFRADGILEDHRVKLDGVELDPESVPTLF